VLGGFLDDEIRSLIKRGQDRRGWPPFMFRVRDADSSNERTHQQLLDYFKEQNH
jgi:hypothetical protein